MLNHLLELREFIIILINLPLQLSQQHIVFKTLKQHLVICNEFTSTQMLLKLLSWLKSTLQNLLELVVHISISWLSHVHEVEVFWNCIIFVEGCSQLWA